MGEAIKHRDFLSLLSRAKNTKKRNKLIDIADPNELKAVAECFLNILNGNIKVSANQLNKMKRKKSTMRKLVGKRNSHKKRKEYIKQTGGFLPTILPLALTLLSSFIKK